MQLSLAIYLPIPKAFTEKRAAFSPADRLKNLRFKADETYKNEYLEGMFDKMGPHYETILALGGLGFYSWWQRRAIGMLDLKAGDQVCDLMSGTGEAWRSILPKIGETGRIVAVDLSQEMVQRANILKAKLKADNIQVLKEDVLKSSVSSGSMDKVLSSYGVKTLPSETYPAFATEVKRILKPGGRFSILEASLPKHKWHQHVYRLYMKIGFFALRSILKAEEANKFAMITQYMENFQNCKALMAEFQKQGFEDVKYVRMPGDGATALTGRKPF